MSTIEIVVTTAGQATVQTRGFSGPACREASKFLEQALGQCAAEQLTSEFYQPASVNNAQQQRT